MPSTLGSNGRSATNASPYLRGSSLAPMSTRIAFYMSSSAPDQPTRKVAACGVDRAEACLIAFAGLQPGSADDARTFSTIAAKRYSSTFEGFGGA